MEVKSFGNEYKVLEVLIIDYNVFFLRVIRGTSSEPKICHLWSFELDYIERIHHDVQLLYAQRGFNPSTAGSWN